MKYVIIKLGIGGVGGNGVATVQAIGPFDSLNDAWLHGDADTQNLGKNGNWVVVPLTLELTQ